MLWRDIPVAMPKPVTLIPVYLGTGAVTKITNDISGLFDALTVRAEYGDIICVGQNLDVRCLQPEARNSVTVVNGQTERFEIKCEQQR